MDRNFPRNGTLAPIRGGAILGLLVVPLGLAQAQSVDPPNTAPDEPFAQRLTEAGIVLHSTYLGEFASNPVGGQRHGSAYDDEFSLGATFDLGKLVGLDGGAVDVMFTNRDGTSLSADEINNSIAVQEKYGDGQTYQLTFLTYSQKLFGGLVETSVGRDDITFHFAFQPGACPYFQSFAICNNPSATLVMVNDGSSYWPESVWGGLVKVNPTPDLYAKLGVYQDRPALNPRIDHGFDWGGDHGNGVQIGAEIGYKQTEPGAILPDQFALGTIYDVGHYNAAFFAPNPQYGRGVVYLQANQTVYRPSPDSKEGLYLLGSLYRATEGDSQTADYEWQIGALYFGAIPGRPDDNAAFQITGLHYTKDLLKTLFQERLAEGGSEFPQSSMTMAELNYSVRPTPWLTITPNLQYVWHPDGLGALTYPTANLRNALVIGTQLEIDFDKLVGFN